MHWEEKLGLIDSLLESLACSKQMHFRGQNVCENELN